MVNKQNFILILQQVRDYTYDLVEKMPTIHDTSEIQDSIVSTNVLVGKMGEILPAHIYGKYSEFFDALKQTCILCKREEYLAENYEQIYSSLSVFCECVDEIEKECADKLKVCSCCGETVFYEPIPQYYNEMKKKFNVTYKGIDETLNRDEYLCPNCHSSDRDRLIISFMKKVGVREAKEGTRLLQIAPAAGIDAWIRIKCPQIEYETTDLFMDNVSFNSDIQYMNEVDDETYDIIICSHVLEHVQDDRKALHTLKRILKPNGMIIFLVPVDLKMDQIDEEWGLPEEENWKRFGQGDHVRRYGKNGLVSRLKEAFFVHELGKEYFGSELFHECGLTDTSTLYVLTKGEGVSLDQKYKYEITNELFKEGPLVSVILPCYNHEKYVARAIESVLNQTYKNFEFFVADDGSTDNSQEVVKQYEEYFTGVTYFKENAGSRRKFLESQVHGKYIAYMHSDDVWEPDKLAIQVDYMEKHPECGSCLTWCEYINDNGESLERNIFIQKNRTKYEWMKFFFENGNVLCNPSSFTRTEIFKDAQIHGTSCRQLPDFFKWVDTIQKCDIYIVPRVLTKMGWHESGVNSNTSSANRINSIRHRVENGLNWYYVIRDMDNEFFRKAFGESMIRKNAVSDLEMICEKYFLLLNSKDVFCQHSALMYMVENYEKIKDILKEKYNYSKKDFVRDEVEKGIATLFAEKAEE